MKIAIVHDYIKEYGGAERVLEVLHEMYPKAPVYTSVYLPSFLGPHRKRFETWNIKTSWAQHLPFKAKLISPLRLISPWIFKSFNFRDYDVVIVSATGAYFPNSIKAKKNKNNHSPSAITHTPLHICYCHTPPRYLYGYATARAWKKNPILKIIGETMNHFLRIIDFTAAKNVDQYIANSEEVKKRIEKFYRRDAEVVYPPVDINTQQSVHSNQKKEYYVAGGRLARPKNIDLIIKACLELGVPLKVFGKAFAGYGEELRSMANGQKEQLITFLSEVTDEEKAELLAGAKAYVFASVDEDFGILPVEAMAQGTPVVAYKSGGVQETVIDGKTGIFYDELSVDALKKAMRKLERTKIDDEACQKQAEKFAKKRFIGEIEKIVKSASQ